MDPARRHFIEEMGLRTEEDGLPRIAGRILGLLLLEDEPKSLDDLCDALEVSKTSASTNARLLERIGMLVRVSRRGDRRDFYRVAPDAPDRILGQVKGRMMRILATFDKALAELARDEGTAPDAGGRLREMRDWYAFLLGEMDGVLERWHRQRAAHTSEAARSSGVGKAGPAELREV